MVTNFCHRQTAGPGEALLAKGDCFTGGGDPAMPHGDKYGVATLGVTCVSVKHFVLFGIGEELFSFVDWYPDGRESKGLVP